MDIAKLLEAQKIDKERLNLLLSIEKGSVKMELDKAEKTLTVAKKNLLQLEADAKGLQDNFKKIAKILADTLALVQKAKQTHSEDTGEYGDYLSNLSFLEGQLAELERKILEKTAAFKNTSLAAKNATEFTRKAQQVFADQKKSIAGKLQELDQKFAAATTDIDEKLLTKYKAIRKSKGGDAKDVVVPLTDNRCLGCYMEVPMAIISKINTTGWAVCEECGRIIYKNANAK